MDISGDYSWATDPSEDDLKEGPYQREDSFEEVTPQDIDKSIDGEYNLQRRYFMDILY
jgi:hypothetical protein